MKEVKTRYGKVLTDLNVMSMKEIREMEKEYEPFIENITEDDVIIDIGANIGIVSSMISSKKPKCIVMYEPGEYAFSLLKEQNYNCKIEDHNIAITGDGEPRQFRVSKRGKHGMNSLYGRTYKHENTLDRYYEVKNIETISFKSIIDKYQPTMMKIDCEGSEYEFDFGYAKKKGLRFLAIEIHYKNAGKSPIVDIPVDFIDCNEMRNLDLLQFNSPAVVGGITDRLKKLFPKVYYDKVVSLPFLFKNQADYVEARLLVLSI